MDIAGIVALATAIATAIAAHIKNLSQDSIVDGLRRDVRRLNEHLAECEEDRESLRKELSETKR